jgi:acyl-CoA dehydrogenase
MAVIRDHFAAKGPGPAQRLAERAFDRRQLPLRRHVRTVGTPAQKEEFILGGFERNAASPSA